MRHLSTGDLIDLAEGTAGAAASAHASRCARCRAAVEQLQATMQATTAVDVPEPSPLFWDHLSDRVRQAVAAEAAPARWRGLGGWLLGPLGVAGAVALVWLVVMVGLHVSRNAAPLAPASEPALALAPGPAAGPTQAVEQSGASSADDVSLQLVADLSSGLNWDQAADAGITVSSGMTEMAVAQMSTEERAQLVQLLKAQLVHRGS